MASESDTEEEHAEEPDAAGGGGESTPVQKQLDELGLAEGAADLILDASSGEAVGRLAYVHLAAPHIRCQCEAHGCFLMMHAEVASHEKWLSCLRWLQRGRSLTSGDHLVAMDQLKTSFGIQPRKRRR